MLAATVSFQGIPANAAQKTDDEQLNKEKTVEKAIETNIAEEPESESIIPVMG